MRTLVVTLTAFIVALFGGSAYAASYKTGSCHPSQVKFIGSEVVRSTDSRVYVIIPYTSLIFTQGGTSSSCVIVYFSAKAAALGVGKMWLIATIDDSNADAMPSETIFTGSTAVQTQAVSFIFPTVAPGRHTLRMRFLTDRDNQPINIFNSNTIVSFTP
jgi:hypothetical protein